MAQSIQLLRSPVLPAGFRAAGMPCGIKGGGKPDLGMLVSDSPAVCWATFTTNRIKASPVKLSMRHLKGGQLQAVLVNSGNANACNGRQGDKDARLMVKAAADASGLKEREVFVCSTGIIGVPLPVEKIQEAAPALVTSLRPGGLRDFSRAILTSDKRNKVVSARISIGDREVTITGVAKGSGMIAPNMATMLAFITTDAAVSTAEIKAATRNAVADSFNCISIDGDMSTNDTVLVMANGAAGNRTITPGSKASRLFRSALARVMLELAWKLVRDGEGVTKFVTIEVLGAASQEDARRVAESVANSSLVKCSWNGSDPNWGRVIDAVGYSGARVQEAKVDIFFGGLAGARGGQVARTSIARLKAAVSKKEFTVTINLNIGRGTHRVFTSDLSEGYVAYNRLEYALKLQGR
jgi:glutamate N-acetyltransferase/amino-acid N-acetyltransferase